MGLLEQLGLHSSLPCFNIADPHDVYHYFLSQRSSVGIKILGFNHYSINPLFSSNTIYGEVYGMEPKYFQVWPKKIEFKKFSSADQNFQQKKFFPGQSVDQNFRDSTLFSQVAGL